jgi:hypothetical protein
VLPNGHYRTKHVAGENKAIDLSQLLRRHPLSPSAVSAAGYNRQSWQVVV